MDKQKQIEEMTRELREIQPLFYASIAEQLYNAGYRKIPEGAVVLTREELEEILVNYVPQSCIDEICNEITEENV